MAGPRTTCRLCTAAFLAATLSGAFAGEVTDRATEAETLPQQGKPAEALRAFDKAADGLWTAMPLHIRTALFVNSVAGFGRYEPRPVAAFRAGETATVYLEPVGYAFAGGDPVFTVAFSAAIEVGTPGGLTLARTDDFGRLEWQGRAKSREVQTAVSVTLPTLKAGDYRLKVTLTDAATGKSASVTLPFKIAG